MPVTPWAYSWLDKEEASQRIYPLPKLGHANPIQLIKSLELGYWQKSKLMRKERLKSQSGTRNILNISSHASSSMCHQLQINPIPPQETFWKLHTVTRDRKSFTWVCSAGLSNKNTVNQDLWREAKQKTTSENWKAIKINPSEISCVGHLLLEKCGWFYPILKYYYKLCHHTVVLSSQPEERNVGDVSLS